MCIQPWYADQTYSQEDCLYLNIYSPYNSYMKSVKQNDASSRLPIFVWIHGGAFTMGTASYYDGARIATMSNMIVVTINYRLGALGFMYVNGTEAQGNQALRDQNLALKWIYNNAARFGGDNQRITIGGESAGSWSVGYHLIYKDSWPFFRSAILQSGNPVTLDVGTLLLRPSEANSLAVKIGASVKCKNFNSAAELLNCLQKVSVTDINAASSKLQDFPTLVYDPNVFNQSPRELFASGQFKQCDILTGSNSHEELSLAESEVKEYIKDMKKNKQSALKNALKKRLSVNDTIANLIIRFYNPQTNTPNMTYYNYFINIVTDYQYKCPTNLLAEYYSKKNNDAYVYSYAYRSSTSTDDPVVDGAAHADEIEMMFATPLKDPITYPDSEKGFSEQIVNYWGSFIANNKPTSSNQWTKFNGMSSVVNRNILFLKLNNIKNTIYSMNDATCKFWNP